MGAGRLSGADRAAGVGIKMCVERALRTPPCLCGTPDAATSILAGKLTATIAQFSYNMGAYGVKYALALANGEKIDANIDTGTQLVTTKNANDFK